MNLDDAILALDTADFRRVVKTLAPEHAAELRRRRKLASNARYATGAKARERHREANREWWAAKGKQARTEARNVQQEDAMLRDEESAKAADRVGPTTAPRKMETLR